MDIKLYPRALKNRMVFPLFTFSFQAIGKTVPTEIKSQNWPHGLAESRHRV